jgi:protein TonB
LRLTHYIIASLLTHVIILSALIIFYPQLNPAVTVPVFNIDIVGPIEDERISPPKTKKEPLRAILKKRQAKQRVIEEQPETIFGDKREVSGDSEHEPSEEGMALAPEEPGSILFDKETIEKYARRRTPETKGKGLTFSIPELKHRGYLRMLKDKIEGIWEYPEEAARKGITGDLYITFTILKDGTLGEVRLIRTSGYEDLDEAAMNAVKEAAPYWPLPDDWEGDKLTITGHFIYFIGGSYYIL